MESSSSPFINLTLLSHITQIKLASKEVQLEAFETICTIICTKQNLNVQQTTYFKTHGVLYPLQQIINIILCPDNKNDLDYIARKIINEIKRIKPINPLICPNCGYGLKGRAPIACPKCQMIFISNLPVEILKNNILPRLVPMDLLRLGQTCRLMRKNIDIEQIKRLLRLLPSKTYFPLPPSSQPNYIVKTLLLNITDNGAPGKTCLRHRIAGEDFPLNVTYTIGMDFSSRIIGNIKYQIWDTGCISKRFLLIIQHYLINTHIVVFVFDCSIDINDFKKASLYLLETITSYIPPHFPRILVCNKIDLRNQRQCITTAEGGALALTIGASYYVECSALTGEGIDNLLWCLYKIGQKHRREISQPAPPVPLPAPKSRCIVQ